MAIQLFLRNALTRLRNRDDFAARMSELASQAHHRLDQLSVTLERYTDQEKGLSPRVESQQALFKEMDQRFMALWNKLGELQAAADQHRKR